MSKLVSSLNDKKNIKIFNLWTIFPHLNELSSSTTVENHLQILLEFLQM